MISGYEQIYLDLIPRLSECNLAESAARLGLEVLPDGNVRAEFCGRDYVITHAGVDPMDGNPVNVNNRSVLAHYILSKGSGEPENSFLPLSRMTSVIAAQKDLGKLGVVPLLREFGEDHDRFRFAATKLNGIFEGGSADGGHSWYFQILPKIPIRLIFYAADEEFPADIQILLDRSAPRFIDIEGLHFLTGCFTRALIAKARDANTVDR
jgi:hypothetical protein